MRVFVQGVGWAVPTNVVEIATVALLPRDDEALQQKKISNAQYPM